jgi:hypothetical protein
MDERFHAEGVVDERRRSDAPHALKQGSGTCRSRRSRIRNPERKRALAGF